MKKWIIGICIYLFIGCAFDGIVYGYAKRNDPDNSWDDGTHLIAISGYPFLFTIAVFEVIGQKL